MLLLGCAPNNILFLTKNKYAWSEYGYVNFYHMATFISYSYILSTLYTVNVYSYNNVLCIKEKNNLCIAVSQIRRIFRGFFYILTGKDNKKIFVKSRILSNVSLNFCSSVLKQKAYRNILSICFSRACGLYVSALISLTSRVA